MTDFFIVDELFSSEEVISFLRDMYKVQFPEGSLPVVEYEQYFEVCSNDRL